MSCGHVSWWREPDYAQLLVRYGQAEHLVVQHDFLLQAKFDGRQEFAIPGAGKRKNGQVGFADIVSLATKEIWEIKPENLEALASKEAKHYVKQANSECGPGWQLGKTYTTKKGSGIVYLLEGGGVRAQLIAEQGTPGTVLYHWEVNGKRLAERMNIFMDRSIREAIVKEHFRSADAARPLPGAQPNDVPPARWKRPILLPDSLVPELSPFATKLMKALVSTCCPLVLEDGGVAILLERTAYQYLIAPSIMAKKIALMQVQKQDPAVLLYRQTLAAFEFFAVSHGAVAASAAGSWLIGEALIVGGAVLIECPFVAGALKVGRNLPDLIATFSASLGASAGYRAALEAGAAMLVFAIPRASQADPNVPVAVGAFVPRFESLTPYQAQRTQIGQTVQLDGVDHIVVGKASSAPG